MCNFFFVFCWKLSLMFWWVLVVGHDLSISKILAPALLVQACQRKVERLHEQGNEEVRAGLWQNSNQTV